MLLQGHLIKQQDAGLCEDGAGNGHTLFLAAAQADAALAHLGVEPLRERLDEVKGVGQLGCFLHLP